LRPAGAPAEFVIDTTLSLEPAALPDDAVEVGRILDAWGIKGWFKIQPHSASPEALFSSKRWFLQPTERGPRPFEGTVLLRIVQAKEHSDSVVASAEDIPDRNTAERLKGSRIFISRASFPTPQPDEFYWVDLMGLQVINREGVELGTVTDLMATGPNTVLVLQWQAQGQTLERMIPFVNAYIDSVDLKARRILVDWQPDY
jgi:16S rRNA processing protein RimM